MCIVSGFALSHARRNRAEQTSTRRRHVALWLAAVSAISVSFVPSVQANKTWTANTGSYATDANWSPNGVPTAGDTIEFGPLHPGIISFPATTSFAVAGLLEKGGVYTEMHLNGSTLSINGGLSLGQDGLDQLNFVGGTVNAGSTTLGTSNTGAAQLAVFPNTTFNSSQQINVGRSGVGSLIVEGQAFNSSGFIGQSSPSGTGNGNVFVEGIGASWNLATNLMVGGMNTTNPVFGFGTLTILSGSSVSTPTLLITGNAHGRVDLFGGTLSFGSINLFTGGIFNFASGTLNLNNKDGIFVNDSGLLGSNVSLSAGKNLLLTGNSQSYIAETSTMNINGGMLSVPVGIVENAGQMSVSGNTSVVSIANFQNDFGASLLIQDAWPRFAASFSNTGEIDLSGTQARMTVPAASLSTAQNLGLITGSGRIDGDLANMAEGEVRVGSAQRIIVYPTVPFANSGSITLSGDGMFEVQGMLNNAGYITGRGTLYSHGVTSNSGTMSFSGGLSDVRGSVINTGRITVTGGGTTTFYDTVTNSAGTIRIDAGSAAVFLGNVSVGSVTGSGTAFYDGSAVGGAVVNGGASVVNSGASLLVDFIRQNALTINGTTSIRPNGAANYFTRLSTLSILDGTLDLANNDAIVDSVPLATIESFINSGYAGGAWDGPGITSSLAHGGPGATALGYATAASLNMGAFDGQAVSGSSVLIAYTLLGDENLDGRVNALDFNSLASNFGQHDGSSIWVQGDFNYDGKVNTMDFAALAANFGAAPLAGEALGSIVPEPGSMLVIATVATLCAARRRRRFHADSVAAPP
jgi:hypothetical protein